MQAAVAGDEVIETTSSCSPCCSGGSASCLPTSTSRRSGHGEVSADQSLPVQPSPFVPPTPDTSVLQDHCDRGDTDKVEVEDCDGSSGGEEESCQIESETENFTITADPSTFCHLDSFSTALTDRILAQGPNQPNASDLKSGAFPETRDEHNVRRSFHDSYYWMELPNGKKERRQWLSYSEKTDRAYCTDCILFCSANRRSHNLAFTKKGFNTWGRATSAFAHHETTDTHVEASVKANLQKLTLPLNAQWERQRLTKREENREVVRQLIVVTLYLARHCLAFRGHREGEKEKLRGNFHDLVALLAKYSPAMATYLGRLRSSRKKQRNFFSWRRQNQYIKAVASFIKTQVIKEVQDARFFSVSFDETFDSSRKEQCSCIIRYVSEDTGEVVERLVALKESSTTTGEELFKVLKSIFEELGLDWRKYLVGQAYDGASNMRGAYLGLQNLVRQEADCALYIWCWAHRLNLAVKDCVQGCLDAAELFCNLKALNNLINGSKNNVKVYEEFFKEHFPKQQKITIKRVDTTRWNSHSFSLSAVTEAFPAVIDTLSHIEEDGNGDGKAIAHGLLNYFLSEKFVIVSHTFQGIFKEVTPLSKSLQSVELDLMGAINHVNEVLDALSSMRTDAGFDAVLEQKDKFISESGSGYSFSPVPAPRVRRVRRRDGEMAQDEPITDPLQKVKVEMFFTSLDKIIQLISERFNERAQGVFKDLSLFTRKRILEIKEGPSQFPKDAFAAFCTVYGKFVDLEGLRRQYLQFARTYQAYESAAQLPSHLHEDSDWIDVESEEVIGDWNVEGESEDELNDHPTGANSNNNVGDKDPDLQSEDTTESFSNNQSMISVFRVVHHTGLKHIFPIVYMALRIAVTLPVSSASTERAFSKLKLLKDRLRTAMLQGRLEDLMIIACENDVEIDIEEVLKLFSTYSAYLASIL